MIAAPAREFSFDISSLLNPISPEAPSGQDLRYEGTYDAIRKEREQDDATLKQGIWKHDLKQANWYRVQDLALEALKTKTKDLQIALWLSEAWLNMHGLLGLAEGLRLTAGIAERFWATLYPGGNTDDPEYRIAPFESFNNRIPLVLNLVPLTQPQDTELRAYCYADWERATKMGPQQAKLPAEERITTKVFDRSLTATPTDFILELVKRLDVAIAGAKQCQNVLDSLGGRDAPSVHRVISALESMRSIGATALIARQVPVPGTEPLQQQQEATTMGGSSAAAIAAEPEPAETPGTRGPIRTRADAYQMLAEAADFLARTEPHSPTPYLVRRAIAWGTMPFEKLVEELIPNKTELESVYKLLQIQK